jgi:TRAP-type C4-dicarboxylate transport system substrate-binding protein
MRLQLAWRRTLVSSFLALALTFAASEREASAIEEIRIGTLAPRDSVWGRTLSAWSASVQQESGGQLKLSVYFGGSQGDEPTLVTKVKDKTLDGAALSGAGLSSFAPDVVALELPGVFASWTKLDRARNAVRSRLTEAFEKSGVRVLAEGDVGVMRLFSREKQVKSPRDLALVHPFLRSEDTLGKSFFDGLGLRPVVLTVAQILPALMPPPSAAVPQGADAGARPPHVDVLFASSLTVNELKWSDALDYMTPQPTSYGVGGIVIASGRFDSLPPEARAILKRTAEATSSLLSQRVRSADDQAFTQLRSEKKVVDLTDAERAEWVEACRLLRERVKARAQRPEIVDMVVAAGP